jgi:hypothetical protein
MEVGWTRLDLDLDLAATPIVGELGAAGAEARPFSGYAGLIAAVEAIREDEGLRSAANSTNGVASVSERRREAR